MKVLMISHTALSQQEGQPKADALARMPGVDLTLVVPDRWRHYGRWRRSEPAVSDAFSYRPMRVRWPWMGPAQTYLHHYPGLGRVIREVRPDLIDVWEEPWSLVSVQALRLRDRLCPAARFVIETEQNIDKTLPPPFEWFRGRVLGRADGLVARSSEALSVARHKGFTGPGRVIGNAYDDELFRPMDRAACRWELGLPDGAGSSEGEGSRPLIVGYVGRLIAAKGIDTLIDAVSQAPGVIGVLVGDGDARRDLAEQARARGVEDRVRFAGKVPLETLPTWMNAFDALVLPSRTTASWKEQFGRVLIEAMGCGTAVIGSDSGAIPEVIGEAGLVFPEGRADALARVFDRLRRTPSLAGELGEAGRQRASQRFTWTRVAEAYHSFHTELTRAGSGTPQRAVTPDSTPVAVTEPVEAMRR